MAPAASSPPRVVIVGKPNVGKSTLFNRLTGRRRAITDRLPGVTRDPVELETLIAGRRVLLVDTGGVTGERGGLGAAVTARSLDRARDAAVVLLVTEARELAGEDAELADRLRPLADRVVLVVNKVDTEQREIESWEHERLGFPRTVRVAAESGRNIEELESVIGGMLGEGDAEVAEAAGPEREGEELRIAILGKPNTGKSTLLNRLVGEELSLVSDLPGTTRDVVEGSFLHGDTRFRALDTAGIRRKSSVSSSVEFFSVNRALRSAEEADVVLLLVDALESVSDQDKKIASVVVNRGRGIILCLNKWDKVKKVPNVLAAMQDRVRFVFPVLHFAPILPLSARSGFGVDRVLDTAVQIAAQMRVRISSAPLNRALAKWLEQVPVPSRGKNIRLRFMAQKGLRPTTFVCYVNRKRAFPQTYLRYLENHIRREFGLAMIPLRIEVEESS